MKGHFTKEGSRVVRKHTEGGSACLLAREMQIKTAHITIHLGERLTRTMPTPPSAARMWGTCWSPGTGDRHSGAFRSWAFGPEKCRRVPQHLHTRFISSFICHGLKSERTQMHFSGLTASLTLVPSHHGIVPAVAMEGLLLYPATCMRVRRMTRHEEDGLEGCVLYDGSIRRPRMVKLQKQTG